MIWRPDYFSDRAGAKDIIFRGRKRLASDFTRIERELTGGFGRSARLARSSIRICWCSIDGTPAWVWTCGERPGLHTARPASGATPRCPALSGTGGDFSLGLTSGRRWAWRGTLIAPPRAPARGRGWRADRA